MLNCFSIMIGWQNVETRNAHKNMQKNIFFTFYVIQMYDGDMLSMLYL